MCCDRCGAPVARPDRAAYVSASPVEPGRGPRVLATLLCDACMPQFAMWLASGIIPADVDPSPIPITHSADCIGTP